jgi:hypothetical protein
VSKPKRKLAQIPAATAQTAAPTPDAEGTPCGVVTVYRVPDDNLYFRVEMGSGEAEDGRSIEISHNIDGRALIVRVGRKQFLLRTHDLVRVAVDAAYAEGFDEPPPNTNKGA